MKFPIGSTNGFYHFDLFEKADIERSIEKFGTVKSTYNFLSTASSPTSYTTAYNNDTNLTQFSTITTKNRDDIEALTDLEVFHTYSVSNQVFLDDQSFGDDQV